MYDPQQLPARPCFLKKPPSNASLYHRVMAEAYMHRLTTEAQWRKTKAQYWGLVTLVDNAVREILRALSESGLDDRTIVVFTSDHGDMMGDHGILAKCVMYEEAVKVPLLIRIPWITKGPQVIKGRLSQIDLVPTLLELLGQPIPKHLQGESRVALLRGEASLQDNDVFTEWNGRDGFEAASGKKEFPSDIPSEEIARIAGQPWRTIITADGWKLSLSPVDRCELYDLNSDPFECNNLFDDPRQKRRLGDLTARIHYWQARTGDTAQVESR
jgi:arylsulfatase A-like enzyme